MAFAAGVNVITLGVHDAEAMRAFYTQLGLVEVDFGDQGTVHLLGEGIVIVLSPMDELAVAAARVAPPHRADGAFRSTVMTVRVGGDEFVDAACELVRRAGGTVMGEPAATPWGARSAFVADPEGNVWQLLSAPEARDGLPATATQAVAQE
jgi:catechol 2,3-dioxygenase-like lactoylglutathione lyase family enzyme